MHYNTILLLKQCTYLTDNTGLLTRNYTCLQVLAAVFGQLMVVFWFLAPCVVEMFDVSV